MKKLVIYGKDNCPYCQRSVNLCQRKGYEYEYYKIGEDVSKEDVVKRIGREFRTVPQIIFINDDKEEYIGGFDDLNLVHRKLFS